MNTSIRYSWPSIPVLVTAALVLAGCATQQDGGPANCLARAPAQSEGVYGCVTQSDDVGNPPPPTKVLSGFPVEIYPSGPQPTADAHLTPIAKVSSDADGYFELAVPAGDYWICSEYLRCESLSIAAQNTVALDFDLGVGPGWEAR